MDILLGIDVAISRRIFKDADLDNSRNLSRKELHQLLYPSAETLKHLELREKAQKADKSKKKPTKKKPTKGGKENKQQALPGSIAWLRGQLAKKRISATKLFTTMVR